MTLCTCLPNFVRVGPSAAQLWRDSDSWHGGRQLCWISSRV